MGALWKRWFVGLANGAVSGAAGGFLSAGLGIGANKAAMVAGGCAVVSIAKWILQHPLPGSEKGA